MSDQTPLSTSSASLICYLVDFSWGDEFTTHLRLARYMDPVSYDGYDWASSPDMAIDFPRIDGGLEASALDLSMKTRYPFADVVKGLSISSVKVIISELDPTVESPVARVVWAGLLNEVVHNADGKPNIVKLTFRDYRGMLTHPLGIIAGSSCVWQFGDRLCRKRLGLLRETAEALNAATINLFVSGLTTTTADYWLKGLVTYDGLSIMIRRQFEDWFELAAPCPESWRNKQVVFTPGCDKQLATCRTKWNNEEHFCGVGIAMPGYHPNYETV